MRSDNGGEYKGPFKAHYKAYGIRHKKVSHKTPQLNRLAERMNRTIAKKVICMLSHSKLSKTFWGGVVKRKKLDAKANKCIYLGAQRYDLGFRLWDPINKKIVRSRDLLFFEDQTTHDIQRYEKPNPIVRNSRGDTLLKRQNTLK